MSKNKVLLFIGASLLFTGGLTAQGLLNKMIGNTGDSKVVRISGYKALI